MIQELYNKIEQYALNTKNVNSFTIGDVYTVWNSLNMTYGAFNVVLNNMKRQDDFYLLDMTMYYGGKLHNNSDNVYLLQDIGFKVIENVIKHLKDDYEYDDDYIITIYPFWQKFADLLAGAYADFQLIIPIEDICDNYDKE